MSPSATHCALTADGLKAVLTFTGTMLTLTLQVFAWGLNTSGQLGLNDVLVRKSPAVVDALWAMPVHQLAAGQPHIFNCLTATKVYNATPGPTVISNTCLTRLSHAMHARPEACIDT